MIYERPFLGTWFRYDGETGQIWRKWPMGCWIEIKTQILNNGHSNLYLVTRQCKKNILVHRLAWYLATGEAPVHEIDHQDKDGLNNRFANLRDVTGSINCHNSGSEFKGISYDRTHRKWMANLMVKGKNHRKYAHSFEEACRLRKELETRFQNVIQLPNPERKQAK